VVLHADEVFLWRSVV